MRCRNSAAHGSNHVGEEHIDTKQVRRRVHPHGQSAEPPLGGLAHPPMGIEQRFATGLRPLADGCSSLHSDVAPQ